MHMHQNPFTLTEMNTIDFKHQQNKTIAIKYFNSFVLRKEVWQGIANLEKIYVFILKTYQLGVDLIKTRNIVQRTTSNYGLLYTLKSPMVLRKLQFPRC